MWRFINPNFQTITVLCLLKLVKYSLCSDQPYLSIGLSWGHNGLRKLDSLKIPTLIPDQSFFIRWAYWAVAQGAVRKQIVKDTVLTSHPIRWAQLGCLGRQWSSKTR
ncbi:hypothetical protein AVEN_46912-1 [Araneus ventricosus]|uniref:Uncharacterized protein n=1 Tax=Araneus ventricosus TaxID=182803 RepID=A0A4Y2VMK6_ARAVE|nr:hypothetical protein AVEN_46912-1 [Araneus ventricosus]